MGNATAYNEFISPYFVAQSEPHFDGGFSFPYNK
jgi:hypothetical protein